MEIIQPSSILNDYDTVIDNVESGHPIILTKNGVKKAVLINFDEWERSQAERWLLNELTTAEQNFGEGHDISEFLKK